MAKCRVCGKRIRFITTTNLKKMPTDLKPITYWEEKGAKGKIVTPNGEVVSCNFEGERDKATGYGYMPHWSTCKNANKFKNK